MREQNRVAKEREQRGGVPPRPSDYSTRRRILELAHKKNWDLRTNDLNSRNNTRMSL